MSLSDYYGSLIGRAFGPRFDRARKIHFGVGMAAEVMLLGARLLLPPASVTLFEQIRAYGWIVALAYLLLAFIIALGRESYELHLETLARIPDPNRADIRDKLSRMMIDADAFIVHVDRVTAQKYKDEIARWVERMDSRFLELGERGEEYAARFRSIPRLSGANHTETMKALRAVRALLDDVAKYYQ